MTADFGLWVSDEVVGTQTVCRVRNTETGAIGYRQIRWSKQQATLYGPVYSSPNCVTRSAMAELLGGEDQLQEYLEDNPSDRPATILWD